MRNSNTLFEGIEFDDEFSQFIEKFLSDFENNPKSYKARMTTFVELNLPNKHGDTLLHFAARNNKKNKVEHSKEEMHLQKQFIRFLLRGGAEINKKNKKGETALDYALKDRLYPIATILLKWGADIENRIDDKTWIHRAIEQNDYKLAEFLLKMGANCQATYGQHTFIQAPINLIAEKKLPEAWWKLFIDYGAGIIAYLPQWREYKLDYEKFSINSFFFRLMINSRKDIAWISRNMPGFEKCCSSIVELEQSINEGVKYNLKAFIQVVKNLLIGQDKENKLYNELFNNLKRLKAMQDVKHHQRVKPLTKLALKQLLLKPEVELPEVLFNSIENQIDKFEAKLNMKNK